MPNLGIMDTDRRTVLTVVTLLGLIALACIASGTFLIDNGKQEGAVAVVFGLAGTAVGALASILAHTGSGVVQVQPASALVPVADAPPPAPVGPPPTEAAA